MLSHKHASKVFCLHIARNKNVYEIRFSNITMEKIKRFGIRLKIPVVDKFIAENELVLFPPRPQREYTFFYTRQSREKNVPSL